MTLRNSLSQNDSFTLEGSIFHQSDMKPSGFERTYIDLRKKEGRLYDDATLKLLPEITDSHSLVSEWSLRKTSLKKLIEFLSHQNKTRIILEIGCGNGWLSHHLSATLNSEVCGMDVNETELRQAARVFENQKDLLFVYGDVFTANFKDLRFDTIILASSIQYFPNLKLLLDRLLNLLTPSGEILILDSPLYSSIEDANAAQRRSHVYFDSIGFPEMSRQYFHHALNELKKFNHHMLYNPSSLSSRIQRRFLNQQLPVFPIIQVKF